MALVLGFQGLAQGSGTSTTGCFHAGGVSLFVERPGVGLRRRQHCFRNLDVDYLTIKAFLLERFRPSLYEAPTAEVFNEFLSLDKYCLESRVGVPRRKAHSPGVAQCAVWKTLIS